MSPEMQKSMARLNSMLEDKHAFWSHMPYASHWSLRFSLMSCWPGQPGRLHLLHDKFALLRSQLVQVVCKPAVPAQPGNSCITPCNKMVRGTFGILWLHV